MTYKCAIAASDDGEHVYKAHLTCRSDQDDVVLKVASPTSLTWINQCMAVEYRFCGQPREETHNAPPNIENPCLASLLSFLLLPRC